AGPQGRADGQDLDRRAGRRAPAEGGVRRRSSDFGDAVLGPVARASVGAGARARVSFEFSPPKTPEAEETLWDAIRRLQPLAPSFFSVTYGAGGSTRDRTHRTLLRMVKETSLRPAAHLTCVEASRGDVDEVIRDYWDAGIRHIVALRGDPPGQIGGAYAPR